MSGFIKLLTRRCGLELRKRKTGCLHSSFHARHPAKRKIFYSSADDSEALMGAKLMSWKDWIAYKQSSCENNKKCCALLSPNCHRRDINDADRAKRPVWEQRKLSNWLLRKQMKNLNHLPCGLFFCPAAPIKSEIAFGACSNLCNLLTREPRHAKQQESAVAPQIRC